jgi:anti-sigma regulatory factor (Ser/Thr protein kinase)
MRTKLAAVLIIPSAAFLVLAGVQTVGLFSRASNLDQFSREVGIGRQITAAVHQLQQERDRTLGERAGLEAGRTERGQVEAALRPRYEATDRAVGRLRAAAEPLADADASWRASYAVADEALKQLVELRAVAARPEVGVDTVRESYDRSVNSLLTLLAEPSPGAGEPELTDAVLRYVQLARVTELNSQVRRELYAAARAGKYAPDDLVKLANLRAQQFAALADFRAVATDAQVRRYEQAAASPPFQAATRLEETTIGASGGPPTVLRAEPWWDASQQRLGLLGEVESAVLDDAVRLAQDRSGAELRRTLLVATAVLAVLLAALLTSVVIGRSIARSLKMLRGQAMRVAQYELPEALARLRGADPRSASIEVPPAVVRSRDEVGEVAEAFVAVHRSAVTLAVEQAVLRRNVNAMFINLARRSQVLVERQLELLDELEREENDPDQLENLFKLDHLAARMRRNDDSLLVLAGSDSSRRWHRPVPLAAVMLAAVAEIEQYQRIHHEVTGQLYIVGHAVADLVHLLAELLENATSFSPPETPVRIRGRVDGDGAIIEITDEGLGMSDSALAEANTLLAAPAAADVAAAQRMGLFVVSNLAARQRVRVRLRAADRGVMAGVWLPAALLADPPAQDIDLGPERPMIAAATPDVGGGGRELLIGAGGRAVDERSGELPIAGRRPEPTTVPRRRRSTLSRSVPTRSEDVLAPPGQQAAPSSAWWSRGRAATGGTARGAGRADGQPAPAQVVNTPTQPPAVPVNAKGLPVRVPMAQLPVSDEPARPAAVDLPEPDPEAVGGMLSRFYSGVRRAEAEDPQSTT